MLTLPLALTVSCARTPRPTVTIQPPEAIQARRDKAPNKVIEGALKQLEKPATYDLSLIHI